MIEENEFEESINKNFSNQINVGQEILKLIELEVNS